MTYPPLTLTPQQTRLDVPDSYALVALPEPLRDRHALVPGEWLLQHWNRDFLRRYGFYSENPYASLGAAQRVAVRLLQAAAVLPQEGDFQQTPWILGWDTWELRRMRSMEAHAERRWELYQSLPWLPPGLLERGNPYSIHLGDARVLGEPEFIPVDESKRFGGVEHLICEVCLTATLTEATILEVVPGSNEGEPPVRHQLPPISFSLGIGIARRQHPPLSYTRLT